MVVPTDADVGCVTVFSGRAGTHSLSATLTTDPGRAASRAASSAGRISFDFPAPGMEGVRCDLETTTGSGCVRVHGEVTAVHDADIGAALEAVMRELSRVAALEEAVLETCVASYRRALPADRAVLGSVCDALEKAGYAVGIEVLRTEAPDADVWVGCNRAEVHRVLDEVREIGEATPLADPPGQDPPRSDPPPTEGRGPADKSP